MICSSGEQMDISNLIICNCTVDFDHILAFDVSTLTYHLSLLDKGDKETK